MQKKSSEAKICICLQKIILDDWKSLSVIKKPEPAIIKKIKKSKLKKIKKKDDAELKQGGVEKIVLKKWCRTRRNRHPHWDEGRPKLPLKPGQQTLPSHPSHIERLRRYRRGTALFQSQRTSVCSESSNHVIQKTNQHKEHNSVIIWKAKNEPQQMKAVVKPRKTSAANVDTANI